MNKIILIKHTVYYQYSVPTILQVVTPISVLKKLLKKTLSTSPRLRRREVSGTLPTLLAFLRLLRRLGGSYLALFLHVLEESFKVATCRCFQFDVLILLASVVKTSDS